jgi:hypothetical protein
VQGAGGHRAEGRGAGGVGQGAGGRAPVVVRCLPLQHLLASLHLQGCGVRNRLHGEFRFLRALGFAIFLRLLICLAADPMGLGSGILAVFCVCDFGPPHPKDPGGGVGIRVSSAKGIQSLPPQPAPLSPAPLSPARCKRSGHAPHLLPKHAVQVGQLDLGLWRLEEALPAGTRCLTGFRVLNSVASRTVPCLQP